MQVKATISEIIGDTFVAHVYEFPNAEPQPILFKTFGSKQTHVLRDAIQAQKEHWDVLLDFNIFGNHKDGKYYNPTLRCWAIWQDFGEIKI